MDMDANILFQVFWGKPLNSHVAMLPKHLRQLQGEFVGILLVTDAGGLLVVFGSEGGPFQAEKMQYTMSKFGSS